MPTAARGHCKKCNRPLNMMPGGKVGDPFTHNLSMDCSGCGKVQTECTRQWVG